MYWRDLVLRALYERDMTTLWRSIYKLEREGTGSLDFLLPEIIQASGYRENEYLPIRIDKDLLDVAGYVIDSEGDAEGLAYQAIDNNDIDVLAFIIDRYCVNMAELKDYAESIERYDIADAISLEDEEMSY